MSPKGDGDYTPEERARLNTYWGHRIERWKLFWRIEKNLLGGALFTPGMKLQKTREDACRAFIERELGDRPELAAAVTPSYPFPGKRPILNRTFYAALREDNVGLVPRAVVSVTPHGVVDADAVEREIDILVMCTGFQPTNYLARLEVVGKDGRTLHEYWNGEPRAFLGITVPNFPNFFMLYGPGTNGGKIVTNLLRQAESAVRVAKRMTRHGVTAVEVKPEWANRYHEWLMRHDGKDVVDHEPQLLQVGDGPGRHPVALRLRAVRRDDQGAVAVLGDGAASDRRSATA